MNHQNRRNPGIALAQESVSLRAAVRPLTTALHRQQRIPRSLSLSPLIRLLLSLRYQ